MITERQQEILDFIREYSEANGFPPSVREIGRQFGIYPATVQDHINALERKGFLQKKKFQSRTLSVGRPGMPPRRQQGRGQLDVPVLGQVAAGVPLLATENVLNHVQLPAAWAKDGSFFLEVKGSSMEGAHILDGDYVLVSPQTDAVNGEIVVALIEDEATVKRFYRRGRSVVLEAENPAFAPIEIKGTDGQNVRIVGRVRGVLRLTRTGR